MLTFKNFLLEARRNADHPSQQKVNSVNILSSFKNNPNIFITYTKLPKVGINPRSQHPYEPIGVYSYPLNTIIKEIESGGIRNVPYAGDTAKYVFILESKIKPTEVEKYSLSDYKKDLKKLETFSSYGWTKYKLDQIVYMLETGKLKDDFDHKQLPNLADFDPKDSTYKWLFENYNHPSAGGKYPWLKLKSVWTVFWYWGTSNPVKSRAFATTILLHLGHKAIVDYGTGLIHSAEKNQAIFFSTSDYKISDMIDLSSGLQEVGKKGHTKTFPCPSGCGRNPKSTQNFCMCGKKLK